MEESEIPTRAEIAQWLREAPEGEQEAWVAGRLWNRVGESRIDSRGEVIISKILDDLSSYQEYVRPE